METILSFLQKQYFIYNNIDIKKEWELIHIISQWLNKNPEYKIEVLIDYIINWEESILNNQYNLKRDDFNISKKEDFILNCNLLLEYLRDIPIDNYEQTFYLAQFVKDPFYFELTKKIIDFLQEDFYDELELYKFLKPLRRKEFKQYNWKNYMFYKI
jgi:hypothetical protein